MSSFVIFDKGKPISTKHQTRAESLEWFINTGTLYNLSSVYQAPYAGTVLQFYRYDSMKYMSDFVSKLISYEHKFSYLTSTVQ